MGFACVNVGLRAYVKAGVRACSCAQTCTNNGLGMRIKTNQTNLSRTDAACAPIIFTFKLSHATILTTRDTRLHRAIFLDYTVANALRHWRGPKINPKAYAGVNAIFILVISLLSIVSQ